MSISVIDAAGAICVIGGYSYSDSGTGFQDVWVSTDGGARLDYVGGTIGGTRWVLTGYYRVNRGNYRGNRGYYRGTRGVSRRTMGPQMVPTGYLGGA